MPKNDGTSYYMTLPDDEEDYHSVRVIDTRTKSEGGRRGIVPTPGTDIDVAKLKWKQLISWGPVDSSEYALDPPDGQLFDDAVDADVLGQEGVKNGPITGEAGQGKKNKAPRSKVSKRPHVVWKECYRAAYLDEICRLAGRGDFRKIVVCPDCGAKGRNADTQGDAIYRCSSGCLLADLVCKGCCVKRHKRLPFHRIERWIGTRFVSVSLKELGLKVQLNHTSMVCTNPVPCHINMSVLHTNGIHDVAIAFCGCDREEPHHIQLLRRRIYPSSQRVIQTCATFELLELLHKFALTTKAATYDFYRGLEKVTDSTGTKTPKSKYRPLMRMNTQFRHLEMLKWGGRGHDPDGIEATEPGAIGIECSSCPHPGKNLPDNWKDATPETKFLYTLVVCMDANFRLKNQIVSNYDQDPGLGTGMAYLLPRREYEKYVRSQGNIGDEISTCVGFQAIAQANSRFSQGLRYTGVGGIFCGRSDMVLPQGIGNLQKGERYANMDYIFASGLQKYYQLAMVIVSYDIACQWFINLYSRMQKLWPDTIKAVPSTVALVPAIPKLHEPMHNQTDNHQQFSFNYVHGVGLTDGETPERFWAIHNTLSNATKTQGPGSRHDVLDDHFNWWNYLKYITMGTTLLRRYCAAVADRNLQVEAHKGLTSSLTPGVAVKWEVICKTWDADGYPKVAPNPYMVESDEFTESDVRNELAKNEEMRLKAGGKAVHETSADAFVGMAIGIENAQRRLRRFAKDLTSRATARQDSGLTQQRNAFKTRLSTWELLLPIYMPGLLQYQADRAKKTGTTAEAQYPEDQTIWLPSLIPIELRDTVCHPGLAEMENKLRTSQCYDSLKALRHNLRLKSRLVNHKNKSVRGQIESTRSRTVINRIHDKACSAGEKYRWARAAKLSLVGPGEWEKSLQVLENDDIRSFADAERLKPKTGRKGTVEDGQLVTEWEVKSPGETGMKPGVEIANERERTKRDGTGETRRMISWIWWMPRKPDGDDESDTLLMIEWAKSRARSIRATEEVMLLKEEMRRVLAYLKWKSNWWLALNGRRVVVDKALAEGLGAIAVKQSDHQRALHDMFRSTWQDPLGKLSPSDLLLNEEDIHGLQSHGLSEESDDEEEEQEEVVLDSDPDEEG